MTEKQAWTLGGLLLLAAWFAYVTYLFIKWRIKKKKKTEQEENDEIDEEETDNARKES